MKGREVVFIVGLVQVHRAGVQLLCLLVKEPLEGSFEQPFFAVLYPPIFSTEMILVPFVIDLALVYFGGRVCISLAILIVIKVELLALEFEVDIDVRIPATRANDLIALFIALLAEYSLHKGIVRLL
jgi:hypothetical protein